jgi:hypothetical protein
MRRFLRWQLRVVGVEMHLRSATHNMALPPALERTQNTTPTHSPTRTIHRTDNKLTARPKHRTRSTPHSPCCMRTINLTSPCGSLHLDRCARWPVANYAHAAVRRVVRCGGLSVRQPRPSCDPSTFCIRPLVVIVITRSEDKVWMQWQHARAGTSKISNGSSSSSSSRIGCSDNSLAYAGVATWAVPTGTSATCSSASTVCWERSQ